MSVRFASDAVERPWVLRWKQTSEKIDGEVALWFWEGNSATPALLGSAPVWTKEITGKDQTSLLV